MNDFRTQQADSTSPRCFTIIDKTSGSGVTSGTINWYLKNITGANAGKWWRNSDGTWQVSETANAMTHQSDGHWTITLSATPWVDGDVSLEYAKSSTDIHVPVSRMLNVAYTSDADSSGNVSLSSAEHNTIASAILDLSNGVETSVTLKQALRLMVAAAAGKVSGAATNTITFRNIGDNKNRIIATVDVYGNRSSITTDLT
jgi:hypothetical protein